MQTKQRELRLTFHEAVERYNKGDKIINHNDCVYWKENGNGFAQSSHGHTRPLELTLGTIRECHWRLVES